MQNQQEGVKGFKVGDLVRVVKPARFQGAVFATPAVGHEAPILYFLNYGDGEVYPVIENGAHWIVDPDCLEMAEPVTQEEIRKAIDSIKRVGLP